MSADLTKLPTSSKPLNSTALMPSNVTMKTVALPSSHPLPVQINTSSQLVESIWCKILPLFFFVGGIAIMAKLLHG